MRQKLEEPLPPAGNPHVATRCVASCSCNRRKSHTESCIADAVIVVVVVSRLHLHFHFDLLQTSVAFVRKFNQLTK